MTLTFVKTLWRLSAQCFRTNATLVDFSTSRSERHHAPRSSPFSCCSIELGEKFFQEIIEYPIPEYPIPLDLHIPKAFKRSPAGLDLYLWLTYRTFGLKRPLLCRQFGVDPARAGEANTVYNFRKDCLRELQKIKRAWPDLHYQTVKGDDEREDGNLYV